MLDEHLNTLHDDITLEYTNNLDENIRSTVKDLTQLVTDLESSTSTELEKLKHHTISTLHENDVKVDTKIEEFVISLIISRSKKQKFNNISTHRRTLSEKR